MRVERARYLLAAISTGSLRSAAALCGVSQPTISQQLIVLEEELDAVLLIRSRGGVRATPAGEALVGPLGRLVAAEDAVREAALAANGTYQGRVSIGGGSVTVETIVAPVVGRLLSDHPGLRFSVREGSSTDIERAVRDGDLDLAVVTTPNEPVLSGLIRRRLMAAPLGVYARSDHPLANRSRITWDDLAAQPIVTMRPGTVLHRRLAERLPQAESMVEAMSARTVQTMVRQGAGVGLLARFGPQEQPTDLVWLPLLDAEPVEASLVQRTDSQPSRSAAVVRRLISARADELSERQD
ncbi:LysR family transcriptional regulator [Streptomyces indicus]|uniref:LysR family transcriptional regulator, hydrogen peroxide-inducible genes activator n=1 Tax=Streptomyces indicus TaxID=417292 RepID=A0A1G8TVS6_9ACTN|nr:LysR family transcriptional regulator [Streptomyces indicus]SDJ45593.1 LysR family transcriptional regulator, hydrogen peroxide-inducible genes activator [Streptomyces indicus]